MIEILRTPVLLSLFFSTPSVAEVLALVCTAERERAVDARTSEIIGPWKPSDEQYFYRIQKTPSKSIQLLEWDLSGEQTDRYYRFSSGHETSKRRLWIDRLNGRFGYLRYLGSTEIETMGECVQRDFEPKF